METVQAFPLPDPTGGPATACTTKGTDPEWWFSTDPVLNGYAVALCNACKVRAACQEHADLIGASHGVWGGGRLRGDTVEKPANEWELPRFPEGSAAMALPPLQSTMQRALQEISDNPRLPDIVSGFSPIALAGDTERLWRALSQFAEQGTLLSAIEVGRRQLRDRELLTVELPVGDLHEDVTVAALETLPPRWRATAGEHGAHAAALRLETLLERISAAAAGLGRAYPPPEWGRTPTSDDLRTIASGIPRARVIAEGYTGIARDTLMRTAELWSCIAGASRPNTLLAHCWFDIDERRAQLIVAAPLKGAGRPAAVHLTRAVALQEVRPIVGASGTTAAASTLPVLVRTIDLLLDAGRPDKTWAALGTSGLDREQVYQIWRAAIESAASDDPISRIACQTHSGAITLTEPVDGAGTSVVRRIDATSPAVTADPISALRRNVSDLVAAGRGARAALARASAAGTSPARQPASDAVMTPVPQHLTSRSINRAAGAEPKGLRR